MPFLEKSRRIIRGGDVLGTDTIDVAISHIRSDARMLPIDDTSLPSFISPTCSRKLRSPPTHATTSVHYGRSPIDAHMDHLRLPKTVVLNCESFARRNTNPEVHLGNIFRQPTNVPTPYPARDVRCRRKNTGDRGKLIRYMSRNDLPQTVGEPLAIRQARYLCRVPTTTPPVAHSDTSNNG